MSASVARDPARSAMVDVLAAPGPFPEHAAKLELFGRLVGSWDILGRFFNPDGTVRVERHGEWHFDWVLEGRVIQDVILTPSLAERAETGSPAHEYGTTIRAYDPKEDHWRVTFVAPVYGATVNLIARPVGDQIWLEGTSSAGKPIRWVFSEITEQSFQWNGYESSDEGHTWLREEEIIGRRRGT